MNSYKLILSYRGSAFSGFQTQPNTSTVESEILKALDKVLQGKVFNFSYAGRTDSGVHAMGQVVGFHSPFFLSAQNMVRALNSVLHHDIFISDAYHVNSAFHARYSALSRRYDYFFSDQNIPLFYKDRIAEFNQTLDVSAFHIIRSSMMGCHDFFAFTKHHALQKCCQREIFKFELKKNLLQDIYNSDEIIYYYQFSIVANGFLYNMVRNIVGAMVSVFSGQNSVDSFSKYKLTGNRNRFKFIMAKSSGLYLTKVNY